MRSTFHKREHTDFTSNSSQQSWSPRSVVGYLALMLGMLAMLSAPMLVVGAITGAVIVKIITISSPAAGFRQARRRFRQRPRTIGFARASSR